MIAFAISLTSNRSLHKRVEMFTAFAFDELTSKQLEMYLLSIYFCHVKVKEEVDEKEAKLKRKSMARPMKSIDPSSPQTLAVKLSIPTDKWTFKLRHLLYATERVFASFKQVSPSITLSNIFINRVIK